MLLHYILLHDSDVSKFLTDLNWSELEGMEAHWYTTYMSVTWGRIESIFGAEKRKKKKEIPFVASQNYLFLSFDEICVSPNTGNTKYPSYRLMIMVSY